MYEFLRKEILEEFESYSNIDYRDHMDNITISQVCQHYGNKKSFTFLKKASRNNSNHQTKRYSIIENFSKILIETGNLKHAKKMSGIGYYSSWHYIHFLNEAADQRGLPPIFIKKTTPKRPNIKLTEKQVSYIKYLLTRYSSNKIAKMYKVSPSTVNQIKNGFTWKNVQAAINSKTTILYINQHKKLEFEK